MNDISSENERKVQKKWGKSGKKGKIEIDRHVGAQVNTTLLPADAYLTERRTVISQDIKLVRENTEYEVLVFYSPSLKKTYTITPEEYTGYYGNNLKSLCICLYHIVNGSRNKLRDFFLTLGIDIPAGSMNNILNKDKEVFIKEARDILLAGLQCLYCQIDATGSRENGITQYTQVVCNELFSFFATYKGKSRQNVLAALQGIKKEGLRYLYNEESIKMMEILKVPKKCIEFFLNQLAQGTTFDEKELEDYVKGNIYPLSIHKNILNSIKDAFALGYYHNQTIVPIVKILISDHAPEYDKITDQGLCWVHDGRNYKKIMPSTDVLREEIETFLDKYWGYYRKLLNYKKKPSQGLALKLDKEFDELFKTKTQYTMLNQRIEKTYAEKDKLLLVLKHPEIPLHNNKAELAARAKVRKKDVSFHTMSKLGTTLQDTFLTLTQTAAKLNVSAYKYISDRLNNTFEMTSLADIILARTNSS